MTNDPTERVEIRIRTADAKRWRKLAAKAGETFSAWWRSLAREAEAKAAKEMDQR